LARLPLPGRSLTRTAARHRSSGCSRWDGGLVCVDGCVCRWAHMLNWLAWAGWVAW
jgi:hypothetical protein